MLWLCQNECATLKKGVHCETSFGAQERERRPRHVLIVASRRLLKPHRLNVAKSVEMLSCEDFGSPLNENCLDQ